MSDELRILRQRHERVQQSLDRDRGYTAPADCNASWLGVTTTDTTYPTMPNAYYAMDDQEVDGEEVEGGAASFLTETVKGNRFAFNVGTAIPPVGTQVVVHGVGGRYVFRYDG